MRRSRRARKTSQRRTYALGFEEGREAMARDLVAELRRLVEAQTPRPVNEHNPIRGDRD